VAAQIHFEDSLHNLLYIKRWVLFCSQPDSVSLWNCHFPSPCRVVFAVVRARVGQVLLWALKSLFLFCEFLVFIHL
jgi:hypothetical protein